MIDDLGHIIHIGNCIYLKTFIKTNCYLLDFGFILDIAPGGITFEVSPFKLTSDILGVIGAWGKDPYFKLFELLCIKAFLAAR